MPYGTADQVATMASMWTDDGEWKNPDEDYPDTMPGTNPTLSEVEGWLDSISAQFDVALGSHLLVAPINPTSAPTAYKAVSQYIVNLVADLCHFKNSSGRFFTERLVERGTTPMKAVLNDMNEWIEMNVDGLVAAGVSQISGVTRRNRMLFRVLGKLSSKEW